MMNLSRSPYCSRYLFSKFYSFLWSNKNTNEPSCAYRSMIVLRYFLVSSSKFLMKDRVAGVYWIKPAYPMSNSSTFALSRCSSSWLMLVSMSSLSSKFKDTRLFRGCGFLSSLEMFCITSVGMESMS